MYPRERAIWMLLSVILIGLFYAAGGGLDPRHTVAETATRFVKEAAKLEAQLVAGR